MKVAAPVFGSMLKRDSKGAPKLAAVLLWCAPEARSKAIDVMWPRAAAAAGVVLGTDEVAAPVGGSIVMS